MSDTLTMPAAKPEKAKTVRVRVLRDIWVEDGVRISTNIPVLDELGRPKADPKSREPMTTITEATISAAMYKIFKAAGAVERIDDDLDA